MILDSDQIHNVDETQKFYIKWKRPVWCHVYDIPWDGKSIETESILEIAKRWGWGGENGG